MLTLTDLAGAGGSSTGAVQSARRGADGGESLATCMRHPQPQPPDADHAAVDLARGEPALFPAHGSAVGVAGMHPPSGLRPDHPRRGRRSRKGYSRIHYLTRPRPFPAADVRRPPLSSTIATGWSSPRTSSTSPRRASTGWPGTSGAVNLTRSATPSGVVSLNAMHAQLLGSPAPQSRDRIYVVCWPRVSARRT